MKNFLLGGLVAICGLIMTSCLGEGSNQSSGYAYGVVEFNGTKKLINTGDNSVKFYSPTINSDYSIENGDCCYFHFVWDQDIPENADWATKGYATVTVDYYEPIASNYYATRFLTDTTQVDANEQLVSEAAAVWEFTKDRLFFGVLLKDIKTKQEHSYDLSFNEAQEPVMENGEKVYNLYLRVIKTKEGESPVKDQAIVNAYNMAPFFQTIGRKEQAAGSKKINFKINYVNSLNESKTKPVWKATEMMSYTFPETK